MNPLSLLSDLVALPSVTPHDAGCIDYLSTHLTALGFNCTRLDSGPVSNLWARIGRDAPLVVFAGHTDVVSTGDIKAWTHPPFEMTQVGDLIYGRGTQDMKGALACMIAACSKFLEEHTSFKGSIGLMITSGEEGEEYHHGTPQILSYLANTNQAIDFCVVGEPSCHQRLGDTIKIGRRGSLHGHLHIKGHQGHVAYPHKAKNAIHEVLKALDALVNTTWDEGHAQFPPSSLQISNIHSGTGALNIIPGEAHIDFNIRYNPNVSYDSLTRDIETLFSSHGLDYELRWSLSGEPFLTPQGKLIDTLSAIIQQHLDITPKLCTSGGTSDGRFIAKTGCELVEFGLVNDRIHQIDERTNITDLSALTDVYADLLSALLKI